MSVSPNPQEDAKLIGFRYKRRIFLVLTSSSKEYKIFDMLDDAVRYAYETESNNITVIQLDRQRGRKYKADVIYSRLMNYANEEFDRRTKALEREKLDPLEIKRKIIKQFTLLEFYDDKE